MKLKFLGLKRSKAESTELKPEPKPVSELAEQLAAANVTISRQQARITALENSLRETEAKTHSEANRLAVRMVASQGSPEASLPKGLGSDGDPREKALREYQKLMTEQAGLKDEELQAKAKEAGAFFVKNFKLLTPPQAGA